MKNHRKKVKGMEHLSNWIFRDLGVPIVKENKYTLQIDSGFDWEENGNSQHLFIVFDKRSIPIKNNDKLLRECMIELYKGSTETLTKMTDKFSQLKRKVV